MIQYVCTMGTNQVRAVGMSCSLNSFNSFDFPIVTAQTYVAPRKIILLIYNVCSSNWANLFPTFLPLPCVRSLQAPLCLLFITHVTGCCDVQSSTRVENGRICVCFNAHYLPPSSPSSQLLGITGASSDGLVKVCFYERTGGTCLSYSIMSSGLTHLSE